MSTHFIPEDLLRHLWSMHYLSSEPLATLDGRTVIVHECGTLNRESGPDFHNAVVEIAGTTYRGDVEFHRSIDDWRAHRHGRNPRYNRVILHVVLNKPETQGPAVPTTSESGRQIPVLVLSGALTVPLERIGDSLAREEYFSHAGAVACFRMNDRCPAAVIYPWISTLASRRVCAKRDRFYMRLCELHREQDPIVDEPHGAYDADADEIPLPDESGPGDPRTLRDETAWEQLLYEGIMDCLGYSKNRAPFCTLAREVSIARLKKASRIVEVQPFEIQAVLFTFSGLLPDVTETGDQPSKVVVHQLKSAWTSLQASLRARQAEGLFALPAHHKAEWIFAPTRPSNFPTVRLAAASMLASKILSEHFLKRVMGIVGGKYVSPDAKRAQLRHALDPGPDAYWSFHYSFTEAASKPHAVLGEARMDDIIVNAVIPIALLYARVFERPEIAEHAMNIAREMPLLEDNAVLRKLERQVFLGKVQITSAYQQQGALELYRQYCTKKRCNECEIGLEIAKAAPVM